MKKKIDSKGMSLVGVLIASSILLTTILTLTSFMSQIYREFQRMNEKTAYNDLFEEFKLDLGRETRCTDALKNTPLNLSLIGESSSPQPIQSLSPILISQFPYLNSKTNILMLDFISIQPLEPISTTPTIYKAKLFLIVKKSTGQEVSVLKPRPILLTLEMNGSTIKSCKGENEGTPTKIIKINTTFTPDNRVTDPNPTDIKIELSCPEKYYVVQCLSTAEKCVFPPCVARHFSSRDTSATGDPKDPKGRAVLTLSTYTNSSGLDTCRFYGSVKLTRLSEQDVKKANGLNLFTAKCAPGEPE